MLYRLLRPFLFMLDPEFAHGLALHYLQWRGEHQPPAPIVHNPIELMGIKFPNRVGLAAGFDKNGVAIKGLASLGFGHIEIGTVTPKPQRGNDRPRIFRLSDHNGVINRMGFPNEGVDVLTERLKTLRQRPILGINIGKNKDTANDEAVNDYVYCLQKVYPFADYIVINISSPNTPHLRELQQVDQLTDLLTTLKNMQSLLSHEYQHYVPLVIKVAPDLDPSQIAEMSQVLLSTEIDGQFRAQLGPDFPIIGVGGIMSLKDAQQKLEAGAQLIQLYSGLIYGGPDLVKTIVTI